MAITAQFAFADLTTGCSWVVEATPHTYATFTLLRERRRGKTSGIFPAKALVSSPDSPFPHCSFPGVFYPYGDITHVHQLQLAENLLHKRQGPSFYRMLASINTTLTVSTCWLKGGLHSVSNATMPALCASQNVPDSSVQVRLCHGDSGKSPQ
jgi:hypothetical protein